MAKKQVMNDVESDESDAGEKNEKEDPKEELAEIREKFKKAINYWSDDRAAALDDIKFRAGDQWPEEVKNQREKDLRPCLTVDKLNQYVRQIVNDGRQNRPSIKVRPVDGGSDIATSEIFSGIIKHIEDQSGADAAYDTALDCSATSGTGAFRVLTDYVHDETFDQEIYIRRIRNPLSVVIDPLSKEADASDMKFCFVIDEMSKEEFEDKYPGKTPKDFVTDDTISDWYGEKVRIAEYWEVEENDRMLYLLEDGTTVAEDEYKALESEGMSLESRVKDKRNIPTRKVFRSLICGSDYLEEPVEWAGKWIPVLLVFGNESDIEGKVTHSGIIRPSKDPQRLYNYSRSAFAERVALTPKAPWVAAEGQVEDYENEWNTANTKNHSVLRYKPTTLAGHQVPPPQRQPASDIPSGFAQDMQISEHDIQGAIGMYSSSLGAPSNERSGKAILARQREGDTGTFHYHDNLNRAIRHCGRILVDLIPKIYDTNRVVRILGYDGKPDQVQLNPDIQTASQKLGLKNIYNLSVGRYDVTISTGPSYNTLRVEAAESMASMVQAQPELMAVVGDLMVKNMDWPGAEEISERLKIMLPPQIQEAEQAKKQGISPEVAQMQAQVQQIMEQAEQKILELQQVAEELQSKLQDKSISEQTAYVKAQTDQAKLQIEQFKAETDRMQAEIAAQTAIAAASATPPEPVDTSEFDALKLQYEDRWKQLEAETKIMIANIQDETKLMIANIQADTSMRTAALSTVDSAKEQKRL